jgi:hypothetical protein
MTRYLVTLSSFYASVLDVRHEVEASNMDEAVQRALEKIKKSDRHTWREKMVQRLIN